MMYKFLSKKWTYYVEWEREVDESDLEYFEDWKRIQQHRTFDRNLYDDYKVYVMNKSTKYDRLIPSTYAMGGESDHFGNELSFTNKLVS